MTIYTPADLAEHLQVSVDTIKRRIVSGQLAASNIGTATRPKYRVTQSQLDEYLDSRLVRNAPPQPSPRPRRPKSRQDLIGL